MGLDDLLDESARFDEACEEAAKQRDINAAVRRRIVDDVAAQVEIRKAMLADLHRVHEHPDNPYRGFAASRKRYQQLGHYCDRLVGDFFGNHDEFLRAAGLKDKRNTTRTRNRAAKLHSAQQVARYAHENVLTWAGRWDRAKTLRGNIEVIVGSDFHSFMVDPFALHVFIEAIKIVSPDVVVLNGDVWDFPSVSRHRRLPGHFHLSLQDDIDFGVKRILAPVRRAAPNATIYFVMGNHEYRLVNYLADTAPDLAELRCLNFGELLKLEDYEVTMVCRSNFLTTTAKQRERDIAENWVELGGYVFTHGTLCGKNAAGKMLARFQKSGTSGHVHCPEVAFDNKLGTGPIHWMVTPMMAGFAVGRDYVPDPSRWQMGFGHVSINTRTGSSSSHPVIVHPDWATFGGRQWTPTKAVERRRMEQWDV